LIVFRHAHRAYPFLWEGSGQPEGRWNRLGQGPTHYLADTPDGAWAEFLRHEEITDPIDLEGVERAIWAVELSDLPTSVPNLNPTRLVGGRDSYSACQEEADRIRATGDVGLAAPSAALQSLGAGGRRVESGLQPGPPRDGTVFVLFGARPDLVGWLAALGRPTAGLLTRVRYL
jgi:hypothetical protein